MDGFSSGSRLHQQLIMTVPGLSQTVFREFEKPLSQDNDTMSTREKILQTMPQEASMGLTSSTQIAFLVPSFYGKELSKNQVTSELLVGDPELRSTQVLKAEFAMQFDIHRYLSRFSTWTTVVNVIARI